MTRLNELEPTPIASVLQRNWRADAPPWIVGCVAAIPALFVGPPIRYVILGAALAVGIATETLLAGYRKKCRERDATTPPVAFPEPLKFNLHDRAMLWDELTSDPAVRALVLFSYGTCVVCVDAANDPEAFAKKLLSQYGHVVPGTRSADMLVYSLPDGNFVVGCHHPNILTFVPCSIFESNTTQNVPQMRVAFLARDFRALDTFAQNALHVHRIER